MLDLITQLLATSLEDLANRTLSLDPDSHADLQALDNRSLCLELVLSDNPPPLRLHCRVADGRLQFRNTDQSKTDVTLTGTPFDFSQMMQSPNPGNLTIHGNLQTATRFQKLLQRLNIDWEEQTARLIGDFPARKLGNLFRSVHHWGQQTLETLFVNTGEYLQQESRDVPPAPEIQSFLDNVDDFRQDVDRLEQRLKRLQRQLP